MSALLKEDIEKFNFGKEIKRTALLGYIPPSYSYIHIRI